MLQFGKRVGSGCCRVAASGQNPQHRSYRTYVSFSDPDIDSAGTSFSSAGDLAGALKRTAAAHGEHEKRTGQRDDNRPDC
jgi:hypothetical protein